MVAIWRHRPSRDAGPPHGVILVRRRRQGTPLRWVKAWNPVLTGGGHHVSGGWPTRVTLGRGCHREPSRTVEIMTGYDHDWIGVRRGRRRDDAQGAGSASGRHRRRQGRRDGVVRP